MKMKVLSKEQVMSLTDMDKVLETVENVYKLKASDKTVVWPTIFHEWDPGVHDMDIKSGYLKGDELYGLKVITFNSDNKDKNLETLIGLILVLDAETGVPLGMLDGSFITGMRTGAAGAIGAKYLARPESETLFCLGAGNQAFFQCGAFIKAFPGLKKIYIADVPNPENAVKFAGEVKERLKAELNVDASDVDFVPASGEEEMAAAVKDSDMVVTATPSHAPVIKKEWVAPGTHFSCIGSDTTGKQEIDAETFEGACIFGDDLMHNIPAGEMEIALKKGIINESDLKGEIGELILGEKTGRTSVEEITIFDACGMALLDIATAKAVIELADEKGAGQEVTI